MSNLKTYAAILTKTGGTIIASCPELNTYAGGSNSDEALDNLHNMCVQSLLSQKRIPVGYTPEVGEFKVFDHSEEE